MKKDYHMHPQVLTKPELFPEFARVAMEKGIEEICITDHMPLSTSKAKDRLLPGTVGEYCRRVRELEKEYEGKLRIRCGIEIDFHPMARGEVDEVLAQGEFDWILGSSHMHLFIKDHGNHSQNDFAKAALENTLAVVESGLFTAVSHVDMYRFVFANPERFPLNTSSPYDPFRHEALIREILGKMKEKGMFLEINPHLAESTGSLKDIYPDEPIAKWAMEAGVPFSFGSDAHKAHSVGALLPELSVHPIFGPALQAWENA